MTKSESKTTTPALKKRTAKKATAKGSAKVSKMAANKQAAEKSKSPRDGDASALRSQHVSPRDLAAMQSKITAADFGNIVTILMQSIAHKDLPLSELHNLVVPAVLNKQFNIAEAQNKKSGVTVPAAVALWARVSEDIDKRLVENIDEPTRLTTKEWNSGNIFWMIELLGDTRFVALMVQKLNNTVFEGNPVKYRALDANGVASVRLMQSAKA